MMDTSFTITLGGRLQSAGFAHVEPGLMRVVLKPRAEWPYADDTASALLLVLRTPIDGYVELEDHLRQLDKQVVTFDLPTLVASGSEIELELEAGYYYDVLCLLLKEQGSLCGFEGGRLVTASEPKDVPTLLTLDALKVFGLLWLGLSLDQGASLQATLTPMTAWGNAPGRFIIAGFDLGEGFGVMVSHMGSVEPYHGHTIDQIRGHLGYPPLSGE